MQPTDQQINELRNNFLKKLDESGGVSIVHPQDLERIKRTDEWIRRFLLHHDLNITESLKMMWETCEWRNKFGTNDITENNIRMTYLTDGSFFSHGKDVDGSTLLIFKCKKHFKGQRDFEDLKKCVVYWFERLERESNGAPISVFFDLEGCGLSNMDMEFTKYLINLFKYYYPYFLNYIIIYEMAWILNTAFKIIKSLLPEKAVAKMKFVNKTTLMEYVSPDQALRCWGGENDYVFSFIPESANATNVLAPSTLSNKKVHFADGSPMTEMQGFGDNDDADSSILTVNPAVCLTFVQDGSELSSTVTLTNNDDKIYISYKMKTTSPEKFRVRPTIGILKPRATHSITLSLSPGFQLGGLSRDKFLVMSMPVESSDISSQELTDIWKNLSGKNITQHKLKCSQNGNEIMRNDNNTGTIISAVGHNNILVLSSNISKIIECQNRLHAEVKCVYTLQWINMFIILSCFSVIIYLIYYGKIKDVTEECFRQSL